MTRGNLLKARTIAFTNIIISQLIQAVEYRIKESKLNLSLGLLLGIIYPPVFQGIFQTTALGIADWGLVIGGAALVNVLDQESFTH